MPAFLSTSPVSLFVASYEQQVRETDERADTLSKNLAGFKGRVARERLSRQLLTPVYVCGFVSACVRHSVCTCVHLLCEFVYSQVANVVFF